MNVLVTGANGQLGEELHRVVAGSSDRYIFTDVRELDITDAEAVRRAVAALGAEAVVNCAAYTDVEKAEGDYAAADRINNKAVRNLAVACREQNATLVHISTDYVFSGDGSVPYREDFPTAPLGVYGATKLAGENAVREEGCKAIVIRTAWLYSPFGKNFVKTMLRLTAERESLNVVFDQIGSPTYAGDLAAAVLSVIDRRMLDRTGVYHYSNEGVCSWYDFARAICEEAGHTCDIRPCRSEEFPSKVKRPHYSVLDKSKIKTVFGLQIPYWKDSLRRCLGELLKDGNV